MKTKKCQARMNIRVGYQIPYSQAKIDNTHTGIGEAPGGEVIYQTLVKAIPMVLGQEVARLNKVVQQRCV